MKKSSRNQRISILILIVSPSSILPGKMKIAGEGDRAVITISRAHLDDPPLVVAKEGRVVHSASLLGRGA